MSGKSDPPTSWTKTVEWRGWWGRAINGDQLETSCYRGPDPLLSLRLNRGPPDLWSPLFFGQQRLTTELPSPEVATSAARGRGGGRMAFCFWGCWLAQEPEVVWTGLELSETRRLTWLNFSWLCMASSMKDWKCPPKNEVPTKVASQERGPAVPERGGI